MQMLNALIKQHNKLDELVSRVDRLLSDRRPTNNDGDRIDFRYIGDVEFLQQDNNAQDIVFAISEDADFVAERFGLYPFVRFVTTDAATNGPNEVVYRPATFSFYEGEFFDAATARMNFDAACVDCLVQLSENFKVGDRQINRSYQDRPFPAELLFSGAINYKPSGSAPVTFGGASRTFDRYYADFQFPSAMLFPVEWYLSAGSDFQIKISPNFASVRSDPAGGGGDATLQNEYKLVAVLEGYKKVRR